MFHDIGVRRLLDGRASHRDDRQYRHGRTHRVRGQVQQHFEVDRQGACLSGRLVLHRPGVQFHQVPGHSRQHGLHTI